MNQISNPFEVTAPSHGVSDKYKFISTAQFIQDVQSLGYSLEDTRQPRRGLGMHSMSFSHPTMPKVEGLDLRLLATNSHDATSAFRLYIQVGVNVCANILAAFIPELQHTRVIHRGYALDKVQTAIDAVRNRVDLVLGSIDAMQVKVVNQEATAEFLVKASELRDAKPFHLTDLQAVRHSQQRQNTAWNVFNRVQESLIRGGYSTKETVDHKGIPVIVPGRRAREISAVRERVQVNYKLWEVATNTLLK